MSVTTTTYFREDVEHYTRIAQEWRYTTKADEIRESIKRLERIRSHEYVRLVAAKANQKLKAKFYTV